VPVAAGRLGNRSPLWCVGERAGRRRTASFDRCGRQAGGEGGHGGRWRHEGMVGAVGGGGMRARARAGSSAVCVCGPSVC
jgi:hypothetical protein